MNPRTREIMERYDEPGAYEFPSAFDYPALEAKARVVARRLEAQGHRMTFEDALHNQDASFSIALLLHDYERMTDDGLHQPVIRFSNFGNLVSIGWTEQIPEPALQSFVHELEAGGFTYIPAAELADAYDGVMPDKKTFSSWWIRYFDWI